MNRHYKYQWELGKITFVEAMTKSSELKRESKQKY